MGRTGTARAPRERSSRKAVKIQRVVSSKRLSEYEYKIMGASLSQKEKPSETETAFTQDTDGRQPGRGVSVELDSRSS